MVTPEVMQKTIPSGVYGTRKIFAGASPTLSAAGIFLPSKKKHYSLYILNSCSLLQCYSTDK